MNVVIIAAIVSLSHSGTLPADQYGRALYAGDGEEARYEAVDFEGICQTGQNSLRDSRYWLEPYEVLYETPADEELVVVGDITGDGRPELLGISDNYSSQIPMVRVWSFGNDRSPTLLSETPYSGRPMSAALIMFNSDALYDLALSLDGGGLLVFESSGSGLNVPSSFASPTGQRMLTLMNFQGDKLVNMTHNNGFEVWGVDGSGSFPYVDHYPADFEGFNACVDCTGDLCLMSGQGLTPNVDVRDGLDLSLQVVPPIELAVPHENSYSITAWPFRGGSDEDLFISRGRNSPTHFWRVKNLGNGTYDTVPDIVPSGMDIPETVKAFSVDADTWAVAVLHGGWATIGLFVGQSGDSGFGQESLFCTPYASHYPPMLGLSVGDLDGDSCPDIVEANYNNGFLLHWGVCGAQSPDQIVGNSLRAIKAAGARDIVFSWTGYARGSVLSTTNKRDLPLNSGQAPVCQSGGYTGSPGCLGVDEIPSPPLVYYQVGDGCQR